MLISCLFNNIARKLLIRNIKSVNFKYTLDFTKNKNKNNNKILLLILCPRNAKPSFAELVAALREKQI